jgi:hypothetical protein
MKQFYIAVLIFIEVLFFNYVLYAQTDSSVVFRTGFEEGSKDIWDDYDGNPDITNLIMLNPGPLNSQGNHVMRLRVPPGRGGSDLVKVLPKSYDKLYFRWYQMWEQGYDFKARNHGSGLYAGNRNLLGSSDSRPDGTNFFISTFEPDNVIFRPFLYTYYRGMYMDCVNPNGQCWGDHFPCWLDEGQNICEKPQHREKILPDSLITNKWYCFEMMIDAGTPVQSDIQANGVLNYWIDGIEYGPWTGLWFRTTPNLKLTILWISLFHHSEHSIPGILLDDIIVSTNPIGCSNIDFVNESKSLSDYYYINPNPVSDFLTINPNIRVCKIEIFSVLGIKVSETEWQETINVSGLAPGVYFVRVGDKVCKFVKM